MRAAWEQDALMLATLSHPNLINVKSKVFSTQCLVVGIGTCRYLTPSSFDESDSSFWSSRMVRAASFRSRFLAPLLSLIALWLAAVPARADLAAEVDAVLRDKLLTKARVGIEVIRLGAS